MSVNLSVYKPDNAEMALINKYGFNVSEQDSQFVVSHPRHKKLGRQKSGNLYDLLTKMAEATDKLEAARPLKAKATVTTTSKRTDAEILFQDGGFEVVEPLPETRVEEPEQAESVPPTPREPEPETAPPEAPETISGVVLDDSGGKVRKPKKEHVKRDPSELKFLSAFKLWLLYPHKEPSQITEMLIAQGISASSASTKMLRHMCNNVVRAMVELEFITHTQIKERRTAILEQHEVLDVKGDA
jgi:hypothetical protein